MKVNCKLDYDWKDAYGSWASCEVKLTGEGDPMEALKEADWEIRSETASDAIAFIPDEVNGVPTSADETDEFEDFMWTTAACLAFLKKNPGTREFNLKGNME